MKFFRDKIEDSITLPPPPISDEDEVQEVKVIIANRTAENVESIKNHDQEPFYAIRKVCEKQGLVFHPNEFDQIIDESVSIIKHFKDHFNRKRPIEVDKTLNTIPSKTNKTPSYPSGHAVQSVLIARYVETLVTYLYVRNPMAIAGMGQGLAISVFFGSIHLVVYTLIGGLLWHFVVRPIEEKNMTERFGLDYENYSKKVNLWIPKLNLK